MGNKILVSVFDSERTAFEGLEALNDLHRDGDITVYGSTVIAKDPSGKVSVRQEADNGPIGTLAGIVTAVSWGSSEDRQVSQWGGHTPSEMHRRLPDARYPVRQGAGSNGNFTRLRDLREIPDPYPGLFV